ncbi:MAG: PAS domain S-box protein [Pseudomonadota bacterium]
MTTLSRTVRHSAQRLLRGTLLPAFAIGLLVAIWVVLFYQVNLEREAVRTEAVAQSQSLARTLAEHVGHTLRQGEHATHLFKMRFEESGGALRLAEFGRRGGLLDSVLPARLGLPLALFDRDGAQLDGANGFARANVGAEPFFKALAAAGADQAVFTTPLYGPPSPGAPPLYWHIQVARRLNDSAGAFAGAIVILVDPALFIDDYDRLTLDDDGLVMLMSGANGRGLGRIGERIFSTGTLSFAKPPKGRRPPDELVANTPLDATARIYSARQLARFSLLAVVGVSERAALARFERHRSSAIGITLAASALIVLVVSLLMKQSAQLRASIARAREAQATLRAASEGSLDGVMILRALRGPGGVVEDFTFDDINDKGAFLAQLPRAELVGQKVFALLPAYRAQGYFERFVQVMQSGEPLEEERELHLPQMEPRWLYYQIVPLERGVAVTVRDITERKYAELRIRLDRSFLQSLVEHLPMLVCVKSVRARDFGKVVVWNRGAEQLTGYNAVGVVGLVDREVFPSGFALSDGAPGDAAAAAVREQPELPMLRRDGTLRYLHSVSVPLQGEDGRPEYILTMAQDVTLRREQELSLRTSEAELAAVADSSPLGLVRSGPDGHCTYVNPRFESITGLTREQASGRGWITALHRDDLHLLHEVLAHQLRTREPFARVVRVVHPDGKTVWVSAKVAAIRIGERVAGFAASIDDITVLREAELALRESEARLRTIADTLPAMVAYIDAGQVYRFLNLAYERAFARDAIEVQGRTVRETLGERRHALLLPYIEQALAGQTVTFEEQDEDGPGHAMEVTYIPQLGEDGHTVAGFHVMRQDVTSRHREKNRLLQLARVDALTGLSNRAGFLQHLSEAMRESAESGHLMAVMFMDIDHFKPVNDTHGHQVGDELLKAFALRLTQALRVTDKTGRMGGDEFTIIMEQIVRPATAKAVAAKIVGAMRAPFELDGVTVSVSTSIGLAFYSGGALDPQDLLKQADLLMYEAKQAGRNTYRSAA